MAQTLDCHIVATPGTLGGKPRIAGRRISVADVAVWHEWQGQTAEEIATTINLTLAQVHAALAYYYDHKDEIDTYLRESEELIEAMKKRYPSKLAAKLHGSGD